MAGISGINIEKECLTLSKDVFDRKNPTQFCAFGFGNDNLIVSAAHTKQQDSPKNIWDEFCSILPDNETRYAVYNFKYVSPQDDITREKKLFIMWAPENATTKDKLIVTMHAKDVHNRLAPGAINIQANDMIDISYNSILKRIKKSCYCL